jgi:hypothetical protein
MLTLDLIKYLIRLAVAYFELKNTSFYQDVSDKHLKRKKDYADEINRLRNIGTTDATDKADKLFHVAQEEQRAWEHISASYIASIKGNNNSN